MKKPVVAVDFDDVVANFNLSYTHHHNTFHKEPIMTFEGIYTYDMTELYGVPIEELVHRVRYFCHNHHDEITPIASRDSLLELSRQFDPHVVTSRCESLRDITSDWLKQNELDLFQELHFTNGFGSTFPHKRSKTEVCRKIGATVLIEDGPENALDVADGGIRVFLFDRPWNRDVEHHNITRVHSWSQIIELLAA